jgi:hypothetical protein
MLHIVSQLLQHWDRGIEIEKEGDKRKEKEKMEGRKKRREA